MQAQDVHADMNANYLGTYTFDSLAAFQAGQPTSYSRRIGDPLINTLNVMNGMYVQDDIRVRKNLTFSPGLRYEVQSHIHDYNNVSPRFGFTWAPGISGDVSTCAIKPIAGTFALSDVAGIVAKTYPCWSSAASGTPIA